MGDQQENSEKKHVSRNNSINCDQVAWLLDIFERGLPPSRHPRISRSRDMQKYAMLYEVMEVADLKFSDDMARSNGTPPDARLNDKYIHP